MQICLLERHTVDFAFRHPIYPVGMEYIKVCWLPFRNDLVSFHLGPKLLNWSLSQKPGSIGLGHNHSHLTDSTAAILGNHERGVQAGSQLKLQCRILKILQPHEKPPFDETMKWLHNGQKVGILYWLLFDWQHQKLSNCPKKMANFFSPWWTFTARNGHRNNVLETWRFLCTFCFPCIFCYYWDDRLFFRE